MSDDIRWLTRRMVETFHREKLSRHGGGTGLRGRELLESALARPRNRAAYDDDATVFDLAAEYCAGIVSNHPFVDGNKRTGLLAAAVFPSLNGHPMEADEAETVVTIEGLAAGRTDTDEIAAWLARNAVASEK